MALVLSNHTLWLEPVCEPPDIITLYLRYPPEG